MDNNATDTTTTQNPGWQTLYRSIWRWHFFAGLIVAPFMLILAVTGAIYLFNDEINDALYTEQRFVAQDYPARPTSELIASALAYYPGSTATRIDMPTAPGRSATVFVTTADGEPWRLYIDPGTATVLGSYVYTSTLVGFADVFHGSLMLGTWGDAIVELMACWGLVLIITGLYLWWPRQPGTWLSRFLPHLSLRGRTAIKHWHSVIGLWTSLLLAFLIITGLPWAGVWGDLLRTGTDVLGIGYPANHRMHGSTPTTQTHQQVLGDVPWTLEQAPMPVSDAHAGHHAHGQGASTALLAQGIGVDRAVTLLADAGMDSAYRLFLPKDTQGVYSAYSYPDKPQGQRTLHLDQYTGAVLGDVTFNDYGIAAQAIELGVQLHMGNYFGRANQILMLLACVGAIFLSITGPWMWWKRRPKGQLGAPRVLAPTQMRTIALITVSMTVFFPLAGLSLLILLVAEWLLTRLRQATTNKALT